MRYTGTGDSGYTNVIGGPKISKCDIRLETLGTLDETQAQLGVARAMLGETPFADCLLRVQQDLHLLMAECATVAGTGASATYLTPEHLARMEDELSQWQTLSSGFAGFTMPGETIPGAQLHVARTVARRAERCVAALYQGQEAEHPLLLCYINRLSSWLYTLAQLVENDTK